MARASTCRNKTIQTMPPKRRVKEEARREVDDGELEGEDVFAQLAKKHWLKTTKKATKVKVKSDVLKNEIWDVLEKEDFPFKSLLALENLQILERYVLISIMSSTVVDLFL